MAAQASIRDIVDTALVAKRLAATFYFTGLTTPAVLRTRRLGGGSTEATNPGLPPNGNPQHVRFLQAALDAELKQAALLVAAGAHSPVTHLHFPAPTFTRLGTSEDPASFLGVLDQLETLAIGLHTVAVTQLIHLGQSDLAVLAAQLAAVDSEHRMLGREIAGLWPANNLTLSPEPFGQVSEARAALRPFVTGHGFAGEATAAVAAPTAAQAARVIGKYGTRRVRHYR
jgi:hypothetical protein